jgi:AcrR family transcriptional regulator
MPSPLRAATAGRPTPPDPGLLDRAGRQGGHVAGMQRRRLLAAVVELAFEGGVQTLSVATICERAGLSRRTFYDLFEQREDCLHAAFEDVLQAVEQSVRRAVTGSGRWCERVRDGLSALLVWLDREPGKARLLVVEALGGGPRTLEARKHVLARAATALDQGREQAKAGREPPPLTAEAVVGAVLSLIHARMLERDPRPLTELTGPLMALIVHPYLGSAAARRELERAPVLPMCAPVEQRLAVDPFKDLSMRLTYRTARVLSSIAQSPGASSRQVADASGISDPGQISRLLARLHRNGLVQDGGVGPTKGMARAWSLTERGESVLQATGAL